MQDYGRALIVGEPTFGKGTVQQYRSLNRIYDQMLRPEWPALGSITYTIQKFYRINGGSTQRKGVTPDLLMPTGVEAVDTGEKFEDNALPWDSINAASYSKARDLKPLEAQLLKLHDARIAQEPEFRYIIKDIARFNANKDKRNIVSLNLVEREKENHEDDALRLERINARMQREGKNCWLNLTIFQRIIKNPILTWMKLLRLPAIWRNLKNRSLHQLLQNSQSHLHRRWLEAHPTEMNYHV